MKKIQLDRHDKRRLKEYQLRKQLFARLASIPSTLPLEALPKKEKRALVQDAERAGITKEAFTLFGRTPPVPDEAQQAWGMKTAPPLAWGVICEIHPLVQQLPGLLEGGELALPVPAPPAAYRLYRRLAGTLLAHVRGVETAVHKYWSNDGSRSILHWPAPRDKLLEDFASSLEEYALPYRRCPACPALFVVFPQRGRPKQYCSSRCTNRASEAARKGKRTAYFRALNNTKRERAAARAKAEERNRKRTLTPVVGIRGTP